MRHLFDTEKSKKSIRLVKQLQDLEEKAYEIEQRKKKQQELDDEAMARALQAELEGGSSTTSVSSPPPSARVTTNTPPTINTSPINQSPPPQSSNVPPPLPVKPEAYNQPETPRPLTPLYSMSSIPSLPPRENRPKSYLPTYKSGVNVSIGTPQVSAARPQTPVTSSAPSVFMNMPAPERNYPQRSETPAQHNVPESVPHYNSSYSSYPPPPPPSNTAATPKPAVSSTNPFYNFSGSTVNLANKQHQEPRPTESAPSVVFDQQYPTIQPMSAPNYSATVSHSAPSLLHDKPLNEQRPVMSSTPVSFDSRYNQEPKKQTAFVEPFHVISNHNASSASLIDAQGYPPSRPKQPSFTEITSTQWQNQQPHQPQQFYQNASSASLLENHQNPRPRYSSVVDSSITNQQPFYQNASSASLLEGYQNTRPKRSSFAEPSVIQQQQQQQQQGPALSVYQNASATHLPSVSKVQTTVNSTSTPTPFQKAPVIENITAPSHQNTNSSSSFTTTNITTSASINNTAVHKKNTSPPSSIPPKPTRPLPPAQPLTSTTSLPVENQVRPISQKSAFSDSVLSLKPDETDMLKHVEEEDEDEWDVISPVRKQVDSDNESEYDYSDMIYDRRKEEASSDPFADSFAVINGRTPKTTPPASPKTISTFIEDELAPAITKTSIVYNKTPIIPKTSPLLNSNATTPKAKTVIIEPALISLSKQDKILDGEEEKQYNHAEKESQEIEFVYQTPKVNHVYQTPKIDPVIYQTPAPVYQTPQFDPTAVYQTPRVDPAVYQTPHINQSYPPVVENEVHQFYPTNILKAGAPPVNPYASEVSADDYGYYQEDSKNKSLPKLPEKSNKEDRHITVSSVNPGQRVWIRVHPTDTGKELAERIHIVASYKTQRVVKITTASGRSVPLDNTPVFEDWNEIVAFKEGESWKVDWGMINPSYIDIISEGKEFVKQLKANFKSSSS